jgi:hypothetical protein
MKFVSRRKKLNTLNIHKTLNTHNTRNRWIKTTKRTTKKKTDKRNEAQKKCRRCIWIVGGDEIGMTGVVKQTVKKMMNRMNIVGGGLVEISAINNSCDGQRLVLLKDLQQINSAVQLRKLRRLVNGQFSKNSINSINTTKSDIQTSVFFVTTQHTLGWLGLNPIEHAALIERIFLVDVRDGGWNWKWWVRHKKLQLSEMTKCQIVTQKRKCLASQIDYFYKKIEIVFY